MEHSGAFPRWFCSRRWDVGHNYGAFVLAVDYGGSNQEGFVWPMAVMGGTSQREKNIRESGERKGNRRKSVAVERICESEESGRSNMRERSVRIERNKRRRKPSKE